LLGDYIRGSHFGYLPSLYGTDQTKGVLCPIVKAVGPACLSLHTSRPELQNDARKLYVDAIAETNTALQRTDSARNDELLASILLLSLSETLSLHTKLNVDAWTTHMQGALALVALREPCQFQSQFGLELFKQIAASIRVFCVQQIIRIPQQLRELTRIAKRHSHPTDMSFEYPCIVEAFTDLRADMTEGILTEPSDIIARAQGVLDIVEDFYIKLPHDWKYDTVRVRSLSPEIHNDHYYQFKDHHVARIWNTTWMGKLHLNGLIYEQALRLGGTSSRLQRGGTDPITMMSGCQKEVIEAAENICASVPQFFPPSADSCPAGSSRTAAMGYFLIWPLFTAGSSSLIPSSTREYIVDRLVFIGRDLKLPQAHKAAEMLVHDDREETWMHLCHAF
jgi:Fungal specific transcription factor domain